jgi:hypothetical protein
MSENALPSVFTIEIGGTPTLTFEAQNLREAHELCHEEWLKGDLVEAKSDDQCPLCGVERTPREGIATSESDPMQTSRSGAFGRPFHERR